MIRWFKEYRDVRDELEDAEEKGKEYLRQCKEEVEADLEPLRQRAQKLDEMLTIFLNTENAGEKYKVPGIGTVYITRRRQLNINDEDTFLSNVPECDRHKVEKTVLDKAEARKYLNRALLEGEVLPGTELEEKETLSFRDGG